MGGGAETIEAELLAVAGDHQRAPADQAGAEQRGERHVAAGLAEREGEARVGDRRRREAAVAGVAGEQRVIAQIFAVPDAIGADAAGVAEPGNADALAHLQPLDPGADRIDPADDLVARDDRHLRVGQFAIDDMQIGAADAAGGHLHANFARSGLRVGKLRPFERSLEFLQHHRMHGVLRFAMDPSVNARRARR